MAEPHALLAPLLFDVPTSQPLVVDSHVAASAEEHWVAQLLDHILLDRAIEVDAHTRERLAVAALRSDLEAHERIHAAIAVQEVADHLDIPIAIFKGVALGSWLYPRPGLRPSVDVDVFVAPEAVDRMGDLIGAITGSRPEASAIAANVEDGRSFDYTIKLGSTGIDVHRDPLNLISVSPNERDRWARTITFLTDDGRELRTLGLEDSIVVSLVHLFRDNFADLLHVYDVWLMMQRDADWELVERIAEADGITDLVRYSAWFVSTVVGDRSPLPSTVTRWRKLAIELVWPRHLLLSGQTSHVHTFRRKDVLGLLVEAPPADILAGYRKRLLPAREIIDHRSPHTADAPYVEALLRWRLGQRRLFRTSWRRDLVGS